MYKYFFNISSQYFLLTFSLLEEFSPHHVRPLYKQLRDRSAADACPYAASDDVTACAPGSDASPVCRCDSELMLSLALMGMCADAATGRWLLMSSTLSPAKLSWRCTAAAAAAAATEVGCTWIWPGDCIRGDVLTSSGLSLPEIVLSVLSSALAESGLSGASSLWLTEFRIATL